MKGMILQLIVVTSGVSSFVERKIRWYCSVVYVMSNFKNFNHITSQASSRDRMSNDSTIPPSLSLSLPIVRHSVIIVFPPTLPSPPFSPINLVMHNSAVGFGKLWWTAALQRYAECRPMEAWRRVLSLQRVLLSSYINFVTKAASMYTQARRWASAGWRQPSCTWRRHHVQPAPAQRRNGRRASCGPPLMAHCWQARTLPSSVNGSRIPCWPPQFA